MKIKIFISLFTFVFASSAIALDADYDRKTWLHWSDLDKDCQDTREEALIRDSLKITFTSKKKCKIKSGEWKDPYTLQTFTKMSDIDIDHIIPLEHAHRHGAVFWTMEQKQVFANDMMNVLSVEDNANQSKGSRAPHEWMPENEDFWCEYLILWEAVKLKYSLNSSQKEIEFIASTRSSKNCE